jgi:DNA repair exonuclease SbcCD ATPase subunit
MPKKDSKFMLIKKVWFRGFADFPETSVEFPETGIVTVTGKNGTGKTVRCLEAPAWAAWGKTLRDAAPTTTRCEVRLVTDKLEVTRGSQRSQKLTWNYTGKPPVVFETNTKAQDALEVEIGDLLTWRRTHVFSSSDAALFSGATDAERKRLLEKLIGVAVFDDAASHAKKDLQAVQVRMNGVRTDIALTHQKIESLKQQAINLKDILAKSGIDADVDLDAVKSEISDKMARRTDLSRKNNDLLLKISQSKAQVNLLSSAKLKHTNGTCYACQQPIPVDLLKKQDDDLKAASDALVRLEDDCRSEMLEATQEAEQLDSRLRELQATLTKATSAQTESVRKKLAELREQFKVEQEAINVLNFDLEFVADEVTVLEHTIRVLGVRGVRSRILSKALSSLEELANTYLGWLCTGVKLGLSAQTELGNGKIQDKIEIQIDGYGGGQGYKALSGGQRRRVDLSLLLALASLSRSKGTLVFDEAFDALDTDGVQAACDLLSRIGQTRPVIVITHNPALVESLDGIRMSF